MSALLFDLGGTYLRAGVFSDDSMVISFRKWPIQSVAERLGPDAIWDNILARMASFERGLERVPDRQAPGRGLVSGPVEDSVPRKRPHLPAT